MYTSTYNIINIAVNTVYYLVGRYYKDLQGPDRSSKNPAYSEIGPGRALKKRVGLGFLKNVFLQ